MEDERQYIITATYAFLWENSFFLFMWENMCVGDERIHENLNAFFNIEEIISLELLLISIDELFLNV